MYDQLFIVKSISKSYGVPGIRLDIVASSNEYIISEIKKQVAIWNINSFAAFFMPQFGRDWKRLAAECYCL